MAEEFKFPDEKLEVKVDADPALKVEIVDDMPPEDRGRQPLPKEILEDLEKDDLEEYSDKVKKRISTARKAFHDERRAKESASREREEALQYAQRTHQENQALKQRLGQGEKVFISEVTKSATSELATAKAELKRAYESGDSDLITNAQEGLTDAKLKLRDVERFQPLHDVESGVQQSAQARTPERNDSPPVDPRAQKWKENNTWFGVDEEMTALAFGLHEKLVRSGVDPRSDDYYRRVDETMKKRFPENFEEMLATQDEDRPSSRKQTTVVAPAARSTAPRQVRITASEAAIAKRLGLTPEAYAREKIKLENTNGR
jgi:hypothetical protein